MNLLIQRLKSRTYRAAVITIILGFLEAQLGLLRTYLLPLLGESWTGLVISLVGVVFAVYRELTREPLGDK